MKLQSPFHFSLFFLISVITLLLTQSVLFTMQSLFMMYIIHLVLYRFENLRLASLQVAVIVLSLHTISYISIEPTPLREKMGIGQLSTVFANEATPSQYEKMLKTLQVAKTKEYAVYYAKTHATEGRYYTNLYKKYNRTYYKFFNNTKWQPKRFIVLSTEKMASYHFNIQKEELWGVFDPYYNMIAMPSVALAKKHNYANNYNTERMNTFLHENFHAYIEDFYAMNDIGLIGEGGRIPNWFNEGMANAYPYIIRDIDFPTEIGKPKYTLRQLQTLAHFDRAFDAGDDPYVISTYAAFYLYDTLGKNELLSMLKSTKEQSFSAALLEYTDLTEDELSKWLLEMLDAA
ncbi:MAG: hypothetical protein ACRC5C_14570 [Bacilli bacterium]